MAFLRAAPHHHSPAILIPIPITSAADATADADDELLLLLVVIILSSPLLPPRITHRFRYRHYPLLTTTLPPLIMVVVLVSCCPLILGGLALALVALPLATTLMSCSICIPRRQSSLIPTQNHHKIHMICH